MTFLELIIEWVGLFDLKTVLGSIWAIAGLLFVAVRRWLKDAETRKSAIQWIRARPVRQWYQSTLRAALEWFRRRIDPQLFGLPSFFVATGLSGVTALAFLLIGWVLGARGNLLGVELLPVIDNAWIRSFAFVCLLLLVAVTFWLSRRVMGLGNVAILVALMLLYFYNFQDGPLFGFGYAICLLIFAASIAGVLASIHIREIMQVRYGDTKFQFAPLFIALLFVVSGSLMAKNWGSDVLEAGRGSYMWLAALFYMVIPACSGFWSWISLGFSRFLGERVLKHFNPGSLFLHLVIDLLASVALFLGSVFTIILMLVISALDVETVRTYVETVLADPWGEGLWASLTILISLAPSLLHIAIVVVPGLMFSWTSGLGKKVAQRLEKQGSTGFIQEVASAYMVFPWALGFSLTIILAWDAPRLLSRAFPPLAELVDLIALGALDIGAVIEPHLTVFNQIVVFLVVMLVVFGLAFLFGYVSWRRQARQKKI